MKRASSISPISPTRSRHAAAAAIILAVATTVPAFADSYFWSATPSNTDWTTGANWNLGTQTGSPASVPPTSADTVYINTGSTLVSPVTLNNGAANVVGPLNLAQLANASAYLSINGS